MGRFSIIFHSYFKKSLTVITKHLHFIHKVNAISDKTQQYSKD